MDDVESVPGLDGQKMSKSYGNTLPLFATEEETKKLIMGSAMDSKEISESKNPEDYPVYKIYKLFASPEEDEQMRKQFTDGGVGYGDIKNQIVYKVNNSLKPMRERYDALITDPEYVYDVLKQGAEKANDIANAKLSDVRKRVGLTN